MIKTPVNVVIDTNVIISSIVFGGKPKQILKLVQESKINAITSPVLLAELLEILVKKFHFTTDKIILVNELVKENFILVYPNKTIDVVSDEDDNRVLEAAIKGKCGYILTGDKDLLDLITFEKIIITTPSEFLKNLGIN